jgi:hypothetical protein
MTRMLITCVAVAISVAAALYFARLGLVALEQTVFRHSNDPEMGTSLLQLSWPQ